MEILRMEPLDVFSIRSARPFDVGGITHADFVWPPPAWTVLGALRGVLAEMLGLPAVEYGRAASRHPRRADVVDLLGNPDGHAKFTLGPTLLFDSEKNDLRWPLPADVFAVREGTKITLRRLAAIPHPAQARCNVRPQRERILVPPASLSAHPEKSIPVRTFDTRLLSQWLAGSDTLELDPGGAHDSEPDFYTEPRIGIRMNFETNTVEPGLFYVRNAVQLSLRRNLAVPLLDRGHGLPWEAIQGQIARFGADGHLVRILAPTRFDLPAPPSKRPVRKARLLLASPLRPDDIDQLVADGQAVRVRAVAAGKPVRIGGWRLLAQQRNGSEVEHGPRTLRTYYPAGTVLYVESEGDLSTLHGKTLANCAEEQAAGFGFCLVGTWAE